MLIWGKSFLFFLKETKKVEILRVKKYSWSWLGKSGSGCREGRHFTVFCPDSSCLGFFIYERKEFGREGGEI